MKLINTILIMFIGSIIVHYFLMPPIMVNNYSNITNNIGKIYMTLIMVVFMILIEIMMHDYHYNIISTSWYIMLLSSLVIFIFLYRKQVGIDDKQYLRGMIEHHDMAIFTSKEILNKTDNYEIAKLAKNIISQQNDEIKVMNELLQK